MALQVQIVSILPTTCAAHTLYFVKTAGSTDVVTYITDANGVPYLQSSGGDGDIEPLLFAGV